MTDWFSMFTGASSPEEAVELATQAAQELSVAIAGRPEVEERVLEILGRRLEGQATPETWDDALESLRHYLGDEPAHLVFWVCRGEGGELALIEPHAGPEATALLSRVAALYGAELRTAYACWREFPHNWRTIHRDSFIDVVTGRPFLRVRIDKFNGEEVLLEGSGDSILNLTSKLLWGVRMLDSAVYFSPGLVDEFVSEAGGMLRLLGRAAEVGVTPEPEAPELDASAPAPAVVVANGGQNPAA